MEYEMEELLPIVAKLAERYTGGESTSLTYERAEQLMGAVLYCIHEVTAMQTNAVLGEVLSAQRAYEIGSRRVVEKVKQTLHDYNEIMAGFCDYENQCLHDTFVKGLPEFFKWYDPKFNPQNTMLTLDYPVLRDLSASSGIDRISEYVACIRAEQRFLGKFAKTHIRKILGQYSRQHRSMIENLCEIVFTSTVGHMLAGKPLQEMWFDESDYARIACAVLSADQERWKEHLEAATQRLVTEYYDGDQELLLYLSGMLNDVSARFRTAAEHGSLNVLVGSAEP